MSGPALQPCRCLLCRAILSFAEQDTQRVLALSQGTLLLHSSREAETEAVQRDAPGKGLLLPLPLLIYQEIEF